MIPRPPTRTEIRAGTKMWGSGIASELPPAVATMRLAKVTPITTGGSVLAFLDVETASGLILRECRLMRGANGGPWIAMPAVKQLDRDGNPILNDKDKPTYRNLVEFRNKATRDKFTERVLALVRRDRPDILGDP